MCERHPGDFPVRDLAQTPMDLIRSWVDSTSPVGGPDSLRARLRARHGPWSGWLWNRAGDLRALHRLLLLCLSWAHRIERLSVEHARRSLAANHKAIDPGLDRGRGALLHSLCAELARRQGRFSLAPDRMRRYEACDPVPFPHPNEPGAGAGLSRSGSPPPDCHPPDRKRDPATGVSRLLAVTKNSRAR